MSAAIRSQLYKLAKLRRGRHRRMALYAERELSGKVIFESTPTKDDVGRMRLRAVGRKGPDPVHPVRGGSRVGSEGQIAHVISQAKETWPQIFMNHPGPDLIRGKTWPAGSIVIVTDLIGSGNRVRTMLDAFWAVPTVQAWHSRHWIDFKIVAAAATRSGYDRVRHHRVHPEVCAQYVAPTVRSEADPRRAREWSRLIDNYGPASGRGAPRYGFGGSAALIAFSYRLPNNTPALLHHTSGGWRALYKGSAPQDLRSAFEIVGDAEAVSLAATDTGVPLSSELSTTEAQMVLVLSLIRGRWREGAELALAQRTGMAIPDVEEIRIRALRLGLLTSQGRLTDDGQALLAAGRKGERKRPDIHTEPKAYYPQQLRTPRE